MGTQRLRTVDLLKKPYISLAASVFVFSILSQFPVQRAVAAPGPATPTWTKDESGTTEGLQDITYGNGEWVAVGGGKTILTSSDGVHWSPGNTSGITNQDLGHIVYDGSSWWLTDGYDDVFHSSLSSTSSIWTDTSVPSGDPTGIAVSSSSTEKAVIVDGISLYVYNGSSWTNPTIASGPYAVVYADGKYVVGGSGQILYSLDGGANWSKVSLGNGDILDAITYGQGQFVAVGSNQHVKYGVVYTSPDGVTWTQQSVSLPILNSVTSSPNGYVAVGSNGNVYSSQDGITWTKQNSGVSQNLNAVYYADGRYEAVGDGGTMITLSTNANLASLSLSKGTLSPSFAPDNTNYTVSTAASSVSVTAAGYDNSSLSVNGSAVASGSASSPIALAEGKNTIPIVVTAQDGITKKTYTLTVNRDSLAPTVNFGTNGDDTYAKSASTIVTVSDRGSGVDPSTLQYAWTQSASTPGSGTPWTSFTNGAVVSKDGVSGDWYLHIQAQDKLGNTANVATHRFRLDNSPPSVAAQVLSNVLQGSQYQHEFEKTGGFAPYTFTITSGSLPKGLTLESDGTLDGTPEQNGTYAFTVQVKDGTGATATRDMSLYVIPTAPSGYFQTIATKQVIDNRGGALTANNSNGKATLTIAPSTFTNPLQMDMTTGTVEQGLVPSGWNVVDAYGVNFDANVSPGHPLSLTLLNAGITPQSKVYKIVNGKLIPVTATVTQGKAIITFMTDPDFVVLQPKPVPQATKPVTGFPGYPWAAGGVFSILTGSLALWWQRRRKSLK